MAEDGGKATGHTEPARIAAAMQKANKDMQGTGHELDRFAVQWPEKQELYKGQTQGYYSCCKHCREPERKIRADIGKEKRRKKKISRCSARCQPYSYKPEHLTGVKDEWGRVMKPRVRPRLEWWEAFMTKEKNRAAFQRVWNITEEEMKGRDEDLARRKAAKEERMS